MGCRRCCYRIGGGPFANFRFRHILQKIDLSGEIQYNIIFDFAVIGWYDLEGLSIMRQADQKSEISGRNLNIAFPHLHWFWVPAAALIQGLGHTAVIPPSITRKTYDLGTRLAPEGICLPFKLTLANMLQAVDNGADTWLMAGGIGPCRFGYYSNLHMAIAKELGVDILSLELDPGVTLRSNFGQLRDTLFANSKPIGIMLAIIRSWRKLRYCCKIERATNHYAPHSSNSKQIYRYADLAYESIHSTNSARQMRATYRKTVSMYKKITREQPANQPVLKVLIIGEIYTVLEPRSNLYIEKKLASLNVSVVRHLWLDHWILENLVQAPIRPFRNWIHRVRTHRFLDYAIGGHGLENCAQVTHMVGHKKIDGIIHVYPFGCIPEIVAKSILPKLTENYEIPLLSIAVDEQTAEAGLKTRLEAYCDLIRRSKVPRG